MNIMDTKTKILRAALLIALDIIVIVYYIGLIQGIESRMSSYSNLILIFACADMCIYSKYKFKDIDNNILKVLVVLSYMLFMAYVGTMTYQIFM